jgi:hypothetical protein
MSLPSFVRVMTPAALALALAPWVLAATTPPPAKEVGDLWEVTTRMTIEGMPEAIPAQTQSVCTPKTWTEPPGMEAGEGCQTLEFRNTPTASSWKVRCPGPPATAGEGEITRTGPDAYKGTLRFVSEEGRMTMSISGRRTGACDLAETRRLAAEEQAKMDAAQKKATEIQKQSMETMCAGAAGTMSLPRMHPFDTLCGEAVLKAEFCRRLETAAGFGIVCRTEPPPETGLDEAAAYCGRNAEEIARTVCDEALARENFDLLGQCCPAQAQGLAKKVCAGRKYTELQGSRYQPFCVTYARETMADAPPEGTKPASPKDKSKQTVKIP